MNATPWAFAPAALAAAISTSAIAEDTLPETVVTATRFAADADTLPAAVTVITREDIEARNATTLSELLSTTVGLNMAPTGGALSQTSVFLRGTTNKQTLVLIDGVRANSTTAGGYDFSTLLPEDIERIEIVRGSGAVQYGADTLGGVIQIFTRQANQTRLVLRGGSHRTQSAHVSTGIAGEGATLSAQMGLFDTDGFNASTFGNTDRDGGQKKSAALRGSKALSPQANIHFSVIGNQSRTEFDDGIGEQDFTQAQTTLALTPNERWQQELRLGIVRDRNESFSAFGNSRFTSTRQTASWTNAVTGLGGHWISGVDFADERYSSAGATGYDERLYNAGLFAQSRYQFGALDTQLGLRRDHHESFGGQTTGDLSAGWQFTDTLRAYARYGTAYRAPNGNDLYYPGLTNFGGAFGCGPTTTVPVCYFGSPSLQPEKSKQREVGLRYRFAPSHQLALSAYRNDVRNLIAIDFAQPGFPLVNLNSARLQGVELELSGQQAAWHYRLNAANQFARDNQGNKLVRRPQQSLNGELRYAGFEALQLGGELVARSATVDFGNVPGYAIGHMFLDWQAAKQLKLGLRLDNILDTDYTVVNGFNTPGRSAYVSAQIDF